MKRLMQGVLSIAVLCCATGLWAQTPYFHWYKMDEGSGSVIANSASQAGMGSIAASGVFTDGSTVATPTWTSPGGIGSYAVDLSTPTAFLDSGLDPDIHLNTIDFTIEMLVNANGVSPGGKSLCCMCTSSAVEVAFYIGSPSNSVALQVGSTVVATGSTSIHDGNWHHVALVYDRSAQTATGYIDGSQEFQATAQNWTFSSGTKVVYGNGRTTSSFARWTGLMDEIKLDNTARSPSQSSRVRKVCTPATPTVPSSRRGRAPVAMSNRSNGS